MECRVHLRRVVGYSWRMMNRDWLMKRFEARGWHENDAGDIFLEERTFDSKTGRINAREIVIHSGGGRREACHDVRIYTYTELERMLLAAGMRVQSIWGDRECSPFCTDSRAMEIVAVRS